MNILTKIDHALVKIEEVLLALLLVSLVVLAAVQVLLRNVWSTSIDWADLTLQNATVLIGLIGAAVATSEGRHLNIDVFGRRLEGRKSFTLRVVIGIFAVMICAFLTGGGWDTFTANYAPWKANLPEGWSVAKMLRQELAEGSFPQWLSQVLLPIGFGLIGVHFVLRLVRDIGSLISGEGWEGTGEKELDGDAYLDQMMSYAEETASDDGDDGAKSEMAADVVKSKKDNHGAQPDATANDDDDDDDDGDDDDDDGDDGDDGDEENDDDDDEGRTIADDLSATLLDKPTPWSPPSAAGMGAPDAVPEEVIVPSSVQADAGDADQVAEDASESESEEAPTEFEPSIHRKMDRKVREDQEAQVAAKLDDAFAEGSDGDDGDNGDDSDDSDVDKEAASASSGKAADEEGDR
ncbi:MAG: TRAP transporter small permease [Deltaproteobacteria bacterium]|nr:TRAP transporter small permease [Deltaproteobacteria bacterium]